MTRMQIMARHTTLLIPLFEAFSWFDEGLQGLLREMGWSAVTRPQTMILIVVGRGVERPADIARALGVTRQSAGVTIAEMAAEGLIVLENDPGDKRAKIVRISDKGERRRADSQAAMARLTSELERRIGKANVRKLEEALSSEWGLPFVS